MLSCYHKNIWIPCGNISLAATISIPEKTEACVIFTDNEYPEINAKVEETLLQHNTGILKLNLLSSKEYLHFYNRYNIDLLAGRLVDITRWLIETPELQVCNIGYFTTENNTAAALKAAAFLPQIGAIVSINGKPELASDILEDLKTPVFFLVGSNDPGTMTYHLQALERLTCKKKLIVTGSASDIAEDDSFGLKVCDLTTSWLEKNMSTELHG